jgi:hypothetical protein
MSEPEDFAEWSLRQRVMQKRWEEAMAPLRAPDPPEPIWGRPSPGPWPLFTVDDDDEEVCYTPPSNTLGCLPVFALVPSLAAWPLLYAVPVAVGFTVGVAGYGILEAAFDIYRDGARLAIGTVGAALGLVTVVAASRADHRLARSVLWRAPRHLLRLALFGALAHLIGAAALSRPDDGGAGLPGRDLLSNPVYLAALAGVVWLVHWILTRERLRDWWHERLEALGLRPK